jgi:hypothetical protein
MKRNNFIFICLGVFAALALAIGPGQAARADDTTPTDTATTAPTATLTPTPAPTDTPVPTDTLAPTSTATPTDTLTATPSVTATPDGTPDITLEHTMTSGDIISINALLISNTITQVLLIILIVITIIFNRRGHEG